MNIILETPAIKKINNVLRYISEEGGGILTISKGEILQEEQIRIPKNVKLHGTDNIQIIKLKVIDPPQKGSISILQFDSKKDGVFIRSKYDKNFVCGRCGKLLCEKCDYSEVSNIVYICPQCMKYNKLSEY